MSKPDWKDAPEWATYLAMDFCGDWWWYEFEPQINGGSWVGYGRKVVVKDWTDTLERRP